VAYSTLRVQSDYRIFSASCCVLSIAEIDELGELTDRKNVADCLSQSNYTKENWTVDTGRLFGP